MKKKILLSASLLHALNDASTTAVPMVFPLLLAEGLVLRNYSQVGLVSNLGLIVTLLVQLLIVKLSFHFEYRRILLLSSVGISLALVFVTLSSSFPSLVVFFLMLRIATSVYHPLVIAWISKTQEAVDLDMAMGIQSGSGNVGVLLAFLSVGYLSQAFGWRAPLFVWAAVALGLAVITYIVLTGVSSREDSRPGLGLRSWLDVLGQIRHLVPGFILGGLGWSVTIYYAPSLLNHKFAIPMGGTGLFLSLWVGLGTFSGYGYGLISRRLGRRTVFLLSVGGAALSLALIGLAASRTAAVAGILGFGVFLLMIYPSLHTFVGSSVPAPLQTQAFSWVSNIQILSGALISLVAGLLSDRFGISAPFLLSAFLAAACFVYYALPDEAAGTKVRNTAVEL